MGCGVFDVAVGDETVSLAWREDLISLARVAALADGGSRAKIAKSSYLQGAVVRSDQLTAGDDITTAR